MFIFHNRPLHYNPGVEKGSNLLQATGKTEARLKWQLILPLCPFGLLPVHQATPTHITRFLSSLWGVLPVLAHSRLYYYGSNWQVCKSQPARSLASPAARDCMRACIYRQIVKWLVIIKHVIWGSGRLLTCGLCNINFREVPVKVPAVHKYSFILTQPPHCCSSRLQQAILMHRPAPIYGQ